ncbi:hypothetical protein SAMN04244579_03801 [Azotobacter beijerinckii]|uniref:Uncharacterized protein n=1 Tax=Azotobacter beijerinckii TaxID=170623 RepID=A0A1H6XIC2_9GAMM|nr:hypothetical protein [Azotobacter beijerinckii]SEJ28871.1 hypothetical protein SAMN04244579_03801 [Azotobacter beijerinckii]
MRLKSKETFDCIDAFDKHLASLDQSGSAPEHEKRAAINIYERLRTATVIVSALSLDNGTDNALLTSVFEELCAESRALSAKDDR